MPVPSQVRFERRLKWMTAVIAAPAVLGMVLLLWLGGFFRTMGVDPGNLVGLATLIAAATLVHRVVFPLQTLSNLLGLRKGLSTRARGAVRDDALGEVLLEANALSETLRQQRLGAMEATRCCAP